MVPSALGLYHCLITTLMSYISLMATPCQHLRIRKLALYQADQRSMHELNVRCLDRNCYLSGNGDPRLLPIRHMASMCAMRHDILLAWALECCRTLAELTL